MSDLSLKMIQCFRNVGDLYGKIKMVLLQEIDEEKREADLIWCEAETKYTENTCYVSVKSARGYRGNNMSQTEAHDVWSILS